MSTTEKIIVRENKVLKLNTVLIREVNQSEFKDVEKVAYMMESYIKSKGNSIIGPMINYTSTETDKNGQVKMVIKLMFQLKSSIHNVETPYEIKNQLRITDCLFARFNEKEENLEYVYTKLKLYAFENDIKLKGDSYTVLVENKDNKIIADVFMEIYKGGLIVEDL